MTVASKAALPEQGQLVQVRNRFWLVQDIIPHKSDVPGETVTHRVVLECLDDDRIGEALSVIWEYETGAETFTEQGLPELNGWDTASRLDAFISAVRWSGASMIEQRGIQSPFHAAIDIEEYQLEPIVRTLTVPRVNLLLADDVGLGKTIEAGLLMQELLAQRRVRRILVICPASLQQQWQDEMREKFRLEFHIVDRSHMQQLRREFGMHVNPWASFPRLITSMDFIKREQPLRLFRESLQRQESPLRDWDLLIIDEAHNVAPAGRTKYAVDSDRTRMVRAIADHFENRLFMTATPHNGFTESFTALLEMLDPLRFSRGPEVDRKQVQQVMVRRLKDDVKNSLGKRKFAEREVRSISVQLSPQETAVFESLNQYTASRLERLGWAESLPVRFALTMLKKRLLSSPYAFANSLTTHFETLGAEGVPDANLLERMTQRADEDWADDTEKSLVETDALIESTRFFEELTSDERDLLVQMRQQVQDGMPDAKLTALRTWIDDHLRDDGSWTDERLVVFTEYKDTLDYLRESLGDIYGSDDIMSLYGGMTSSERERIKLAFQSPPSETPVRVLIATDAASEGLNLQNYCRYLFHYEIPWNPNRMEQRNGRIDRHGQRAETVYVHHFVYADREDSRFLQTVIEKVQAMREDLGSVGDVIADQVEQAMLGRRRKLEIPTREQTVVEEVTRDLAFDELKRRQIRREMERTREVLDLRPGRMAQVLDEALQVLGHTGLSMPDDPTLTNQAYALASLPPSWSSLEHHLRTSDGRRLNLTFDHEVAQQRRDVLLLHLNHPIMRRAIGTFRARVWSEHDATLNRVSYRVIRDLHEPVVLAYGRLVAVGELGARLHESVVISGGEFQETQIFPLDEGDIERYLDMAYTHPSIPRELGNTLRRFYRGHSRALMALMEDSQVHHTERLQTLADERGEKQSADVADLIQERIAEVRQRISVDSRAQQLPESQLAMFDMDELRQYQEDQRWLSKKLDQLKERRKTEPEQIRLSYQLRDVRVFPLGLLYLLPEKLL